VSLEGTKDITMGLSSVPSSGVPHPAKAKESTLSRISATNHTLLFILFLLFPFVFGAYCPISTYTTYP
jgi:hypothetical protein